MGLRTRLPDWSARLNDYLTDCRREGIALDWEYNNCMTFGLGGVEAITGVNLYPEGLDFSSPEGAYKALQKLGHKDLVQALLAHFDEIPTAYAQRGDLCLGPARSASDLTDYSLLGMPYAVGIVDMPVYWALSEEGVGNAPYTEVVKAFAVGR
jgi:hypothetical protein